MLKYYLLLLLFIPTFSGFTQPQSATNKKLQTDIETLRTRITRQDSLLSIATRKVDTFALENAKLKIALNSNSFAFDGISAFITALTVILTITLFVAPFLGYFFVVRPSQKALARVKNLEDAVPQKIAETFSIHYEDIEKKKFKEAIKNLSNPSLYVHSLLFLNNNKHRLADLEDQKLMTDFLYQNPNMNAVDKGSIARFLAFNPSDIAEKFFKSELENAEIPRISSLMSGSIAYLIDNNFESNKPFFENLLIASPHGHDLFMDIVEMCMDRYFRTALEPGESIGARHIEGKSVLEFFLNNARICEAIESKTLTHFDQHIKDHVFVQKHPFILESYYYRKYFDESKKRRNSPWRQIN